MSSLKSSREPVIFRKSIYIDIILRKVSSHIFQVSTQRRFCFFESSVSVGPGREVHCLGEVDDENTVAGKQQVVFLQVAVNDEAVKKFLDNPKCYFCILF